jgi:hypothetical protein
MNSNFIGITSLHVSGSLFARNMYSRNTNKIGIQCICWFYSQGSISHVLSDCSCVRQMFSR